MGTATLVSRPLDLFSAAKKATSGALTQKKAALKTSLEAFQNLPPRKCSNENFFGMLRRLFRAGVRRVEQPSDLADLLEIQAELNAAIHAAGLKLREDYSLSQIAKALGCSEMNVSKRWRSTDPLERGER